MDANLDDEALTQLKAGKKAAKSTADQSIKKSAPKSKGDYDVTKEDMEALGPKDLSMDMGDDEQLKHRTRPANFAGSDLDVPGSELDDAAEAIGSEDEENNLYSLGGDDKENLEERQD